MHQDLRSVLKYDQNRAWKKKSCPKIEPVCSWANKHGVCLLKAQKWSKTHRKWDSPMKWYIPRRGNYNSSRRKGKLLIIVYAKQTSSIHSPLCWGEKNILTMTQITLKQSPRIRSKLHLHRSLLPLLFSEICLHDDMANNKVWRTTGTCSSFVPQHPSGTVGSKLLYLIPPWLDILLC